MKNTLILIMAFPILIFSCQKEENSLDVQLEKAIVSASNDKGLEAFMMPTSDNISEIPQDPKNKLSREKIKLGKFLYHETAIGVSPMLEKSMGQYSCASCHFASAGFQANRHQGISEGGTGFGENGEGRVVSMNFPEDKIDCQPVKSPTTMNTAYQANMLWNGQFGATGMNEGTENLWTAGTPKELNALGYQGIETQALAGLSVHRMNIDAVPDLMKNIGYKGLFDDVFVDDPAESRYTTLNAALAIAAYERSLLSNKSPFQKYLRGQSNAMTEQEKRGAKVFFDEGRCVSCHGGPGLNNMEFYAIGLNDLTSCEEEIFRTGADEKAFLGRGGFTGKDEDMFKFKVPQLYNLKDSPFYGHGSSHRSIRQIIEYKNKAVAENSRVPESQLADEFEPLNLTKEQIDDLVIFIETGLYDAQLDRYLPLGLPSGNCFPMNDPQSKEDLGCD